MFLVRSAATAARRTAFKAPVRAFSTGIVRRDAHGHGSHAPKVPSASSNKPNIEKGIADIYSEEDLMPPGAEPGTVPTDIEQATGLDRLEILGKQEGIDIFDMKPLPSDRMGTMADPVRIRSFGDEQYCGCTGIPADTHHVKWLTISRDRPLGRCPECGCCYEMDYVGPEHVHEAHRTEPEPVNFSNFIKPDYYYR